MSNTYLAAYIGSKHYVGYVFVDDALLTMHNWTNSRVSPGHPVILVVIVLSSIVNSFSQVRGGFGLMFLN